MEMQRRSLLQLAPLALFSTAGLPPQRAEADTTDPTRSAAERRTPEAFGAISGDASAAVADANRTALTRALDAGVRLDGGGRTYRVAGPIRPNRLVSIEDLGLIQVAGGDQRTLELRRLSDFRIHRLRVDLGGFRQNGHMSRHAGLWVEGCTRFHIDDTLAVNGGPQSGLAFVQCSEFSLIRPQARDFVFDDPTADNDRTHGLYFYLCRQFRIIDPAVANLTGEIKGTPTRRYSRGIAMGGNREFLLLGGEISRVDQGVDVTGTDGNSEFLILGTRTRECATVGFKFANSAHHFQVIGAQDTGAGWMSFLVSSQTEAINPRPMHGFFDQCIAFDTGAAGTWPDATDRAGFRIKSLPIVDSSYPRGIVFNRCRAIDRQEVPTLHVGALCNAWVPVGVPVAVNQLIGFQSEGHLRAAVEGTWVPTVTMLGARPAPQPLTVPPGAWTPIRWPQTPVGPDPTDPTRHVVPTGGLHDIRAVVTFPAMEGTCALRLVQNGTPVPGARPKGLLEPGDTTELALALHLALEPGDALRLEVRHTASAALAIDTAHARFSIGVIA